MAMKFIISTHHTLTTNTNMLVQFSAAGSQEEPGLIKKSQLAMRLSVSSRTIDNWVANRIIPYIQISRGFNRFDYDAVITALRKKYGIDPLDRD